MQKIVTVLNILENLGIEVYAVGGAVRDSYLRRPFVDIDLATPVHPLEVVRLLTAGKIENDRTLRKLGVIKAKIEGEIFEITTFRNEIYKDSSRTPKVTFTDKLEEDYLRRDFTINAGYLNPKRKVENESFKRDIRDKILRSVKTPEKSYWEDPLRVLRAFVFAERFGFEISPEDKAVLYTYPLFRIKSLVPKSRVESLLTQRYAVEYLTSLLKEY